jgi:plasmid stability protein
MATLYVEGVPKDLYEALRRQAKANQRSIAAETIAILNRMVITKAERRRRLEFYQRAREIRKRAPLAAPGPSAEELLREDRER